MMNHQLFVKITFYNALLFISLLVSTLVISFLNLSILDRFNPLLIISTAIVFLIAPINFVAYKGLKEGERDPYPYEAINANIHGVLFILISIFLLVLPIFSGITMSSF